MMRPFLITTSWDDGHPHDLRIADLLTRYGLKGTFYVPRWSPYGVMGGEAIRELAGAFEVGAHTLHHLELTRVPDELARAEINDSKSWIEDLTGRSCRMFCFPGGRYRKRHQAMVLAAGYLGARTVQFLSLSPPHNEGGLMLMGTSIQTRSHSMPTYLKNALKRRATGSLLHCWHIRSARGWVEAARTLLDLWARRGGVFHLWGHSWEIEELSAWGELEEVLRDLAEHAAVFGCLTNGEVCEWGH